MLDIKSNFLTIVRQDKKLLDKLILEENLYGRDNQTQFLKKSLDSDIVLTFHEEGKIDIVRYRDSFAVGSVDVDNIQNAYKQVRYFANHGKLKDEEAM
jgi:hypothetical protein